MDRLTAMQVFAEVAQLGSFTAAGDKLDMSRPMVTRYVDELEQWLGVRLLQRSTRKVTLTDAGLACLARCQQMLELAAEVRADASQRDGQVRGLLRVTASTSFGQAVLAGAIAEFSERHPQLRVDLQLGDRTVNLIEERIDLAIRITNEPDPGLVGRRLCDCRSLAVASPAYLARHGVPRHPLELEAHRCLSYSNFGRSEWRFQQGAEEALRVRVSGRISANEASALLSAALAGAGVSLQPSYLAAPYVRRGELVTLLPGWEPAVLGIHALYPSRRLLPLALRGLLDFLAERFSGPQAPWDRQP
ncbi:LysR family transcriptional regulator [Chromobacterium subtsugae]|uniref:LysR family transcriptional regulator n=1 Tax=Chromobacterium subtsugae TaxID=251747 RepID=A0ABS7FBT6_9NEIS|nr:MULTISPECIES: LysR family transcriptional regulator [Chromobacterium]KUM03038.1 LysR family transcriptional regulator [Chromobacterium subtsugae]KZE85997.1 LysR family transcriptional regulator [Chromobacterium sp. F49]MBW7567373.1 LysR family transcriptional regulator [Chromobacterium subtsugae]MBW8287539.1 LysR family transcriptional regulator [Chromobacterium subtsugae]WSE93494.1 LysR substrate-binding domain-containing protein [Chromobacterium subtsugae]